MAELKSEMRMGFYSPDGGFLGYDLNNEVIAEKRMKYGAVNMCLVKVIVEYHQAHVQAVNDGLVRRILSRLFAR